MRKAALPVAWSTNTPGADHGTEVHINPVAIAEEDFIEGIRVALLVATATLAVVFLAGWRWFPRDVHTAGSDLSERLPTAMTVECAVSHMPGATWCRLWPA